jgi:hypothetical protein
MWLDEFVCVCVCVREREREHMTMLVEVLIETEVKNEKKESKRKHYTGGLATHRKKLISFFSILDVNPEGITTATVCTV